MSTLSTKPVAVGTKFDEEGVARRFPGLSVVAALGPEQRQFELLVDLQERARRAAFGPKLSFLPPSSFHMTVFDLICDQVRELEHWSSELALDAPLHEVDTWMHGQVMAVAEWPMPRMRFAEMGPLGVSFHAVLEPEDAATAAALARFREAVSKATGVRHPNHDRYRFHVTLAYRMEAFDEADIAALAAFCADTDGRLGESFGSLQLPKPELTFFDDMCSFPTERGK